MTPGAMSLIGLILLILGVVILLLAGLGLFTLADALSRQHAATKAGALGLVAIVTGTALLGGSWAWAWRALLIIPLIWLTMPVASHMLARAAMAEKAGPNGPVTPDTSSEGDS